MPKVGHHGDDMILDIAEVEADFAAGCDRVHFVAAFCKAFDDVGFPAEETHGAHCLLAALAYALEEGTVVFDAGDKDGVFDGVRVVFNVVDERGKGVDDVVDEGVADPVRAEGDVIAELADAAADVCGVVRGGEVEGEDAVAEHDEVDVDGLEVVFGGLALDKGAEADKVVGLEEFNFLAGLLDADILGREGMDGEGLHEHGQLFLRRVEAVEPPHALARPEEIAEGFAFVKKVANLRCMDCRVHLRGEEAEPVRGTERLGGFSGDIPGKLLVDTRVRVIDSALVAGFGVLHGGIARQVLIVLSSEGPSHAHFALALSASASVLQSHKFVHLLEINATTNTLLLRWREAHIFLGLLRRIIIREFMGRTFVGEGRTTGNCSAEP